MNTKCSVLIGVAALCAAVAGCNENQADRTEAHASSAVTHVGRGTVSAVSSAGHGVAYGARELGQTLSGTQGNPQAEALSQHEHERMDQEARTANQEFNAAGRDLAGHTPVATERTTTPEARGGGPAGSTVHVAHHHHHRVIPTTP